ncbi:hypothetical protein TNCV_1993901 [Trichonephila clavipes]|nr:hypothetical protein TNCV_1993901 [Trichonephila clavipes]
MKYVEKASYLQSLNKCFWKGLGYNLGEGLDVCKCIATLLHVVILNSRSAASPIVKLMEREEKWETSDHLKGVLRQNWGCTELKCTVTCVVLKAMVNGSRTSSPLPR